MVEELKLLNLFLFLKENVCKLVNEHFFKLFDL